VRSSRESCDGITSLRLSECQCLTSDVSVDLMSDVESGRSVVGERGQSCSRTYRPNLGGEINSLL
jgi:hypothetical protein